MNNYIKLFLLTVLTCWLGIACSVPTKQTPSSTTIKLPPTQTTPIIDEPDTIDLSLPETPAEKVEPPSVSTIKSPVVRVLLAESKKNIQIQFSGRINVYTQDLSQKFKISKPGTLEIAALSANSLQAGSLKTDQTVIIEPVKDTLLTFEKNSYTGKFYIAAKNGTFSVIEHTSLEDYLYGVLPYEMSYSWPLEALKAQAVAARTYTLKTMEGTKSKTFDLYNDVRSQMYKGSGKKYNSVKQAVDATAGQVLSHEGKIFYTYYHANCGGGTDDVRSWNGSSKSIKPLSGASCKYDSHSKSHSWQMKVPTSKVLTYTKSVGLSGTLKGIKITNKTNTGRATNLTITTTKGSKNVACGKFRLATGIKSCKITKISLKSSEVLFEGKGYGHGVGLCQDGANGMAKANKDYKKILKNYYPGADIMVLK